VKPLPPKQEAIFRTLIFYDIVSVTRVVNPLVKNDKMNMGEQRGVSLNL
jgi:hypothetical protein